MNKQSLYNTPQAKKSGNRDILVVLSIVLGIFLVGCCGMVAVLYWALSDGENGGEATASPVSLTEATLRIAYSPEKEALFTALVDEFNAQDFETPDGEKMNVEVVQLDPEAMIEATHGDAQWSDAFERFRNHLAANKIDIGKTSPLILRSFVSNAIPARMAAEGEPI